jgi:hypothetical protein
MANIICDRNIATYWCELCGEYSICDRAEKWMHEHGYSHIDGSKIGRLSLGGKT